MIHVIWNNEINDNRIQLSKLNITLPNRPKYEKTKKEIMHAISRNAHFLTQNKWAIALLNEIYCNLSWKAISTN